MKQSYLILLSTLIIIGSQWLVGASNSQEDSSHELEQQAYLQSEVISTINTIKDLLVENSEKTYESVNTDTGAVVRLDASDLEETIRYIIREEIQQLAFNQPVSAVVAETNPESIQEADLAYAESTEIIDSAISNGGWDSSLTASLR
ncbi:MAG: hypothetical protein COA99_14240, partial [Moraxellaceae bacterium]